MVDMGRFYTERCMGESAFKARDYNAAVSEERQNNRVVRDNQEFATAKTLRNPGPADQFIPARTATPLPTTVLGRLVINLQQGLQTLQQGLRQAFGVVAQPVQAFAQAVGNLPTFMARTVSQILSFFFGNKKDQKQTQDEADKRAQDDFVLADLFGAGKIHESAQSELGGGGQ